MTQTPNAAPSAGQFTAIKHDIVKELFLKTADQTYVVARWCFLNGLYLDFYWNALHALEKYLKAVLLINGQSAKVAADGTAYSHDLEKLFAAVQLIASDLLPATLTRPADLQIQHWRDESVDNFLKRLNDLGRAENRYNIFGFSQQPEDLHKLDMVIFSVRQLCVPLDAPFWGRRQDAPNDKTFRQMLVEHPRSVLRRVGTKFYDLIGRKGTIAVREAALIHNLPFAPADYDHGELRSGSSADNPVLYRRLLVYADNGTQYAEDAEGLADICDWLIESVQLSPAVKAEINAAKGKLMVQARRHARREGKAGRVH
ncbi:hypothetical protein [Mesorhizobium australicum]|uniref:hypothetical protein n=1 Tax=Mesorhizobium australicum TaxID=536018 RepID=UPI00333D0DE5